MRSADLSFGNFLHDIAKRVILPTFGDALKPIIAMHVRVFQCHIQTVITSLSRQILEKKEEKLFLKMHFRDCPPRFLYTSTFAHPFISSTV